MLDIQRIRKNSEEVKTGVEKKQVDPGLVDEFLELDEEWRRVTGELDSLRARQNEVSKKIGKDKSEDLIEEAKELKAQIQDKEGRERDLLGKRDAVLAKLPNIPFEDVPVGENEEDNVVVKEVGEKPNFDFEPKDHMELGESLGIIDTKKAAEVSGSRFNYLLGGAVLLEFALVKLCYDILLEENFKPIIPPVLAKPDVMRQWGKGPFLDEGDAFYIDEDDLYLVGSSEHTIGPYHMEETFEEGELPLRYVGFSSCFRREAGSYGKDTRGILRVHQFDKVEMIVVSHPDKSQEEHENLVAMQEKIVSALDLPYQVVEICSGDMTWVDAKQFDIKVWIPSQGRYRETHSASNTTDFQSQGIRAKYQTQNGDKELVHMLNGTACAIGRMVVAIMENNQTEDGTIIVPEALRDYVGKKEIS